MINNGKLFKTATVDEWLDCGTLTAWLETTGVILEKENHPFDAKNSQIQISFHPYSLVMM